MQTGQNSIAPENSFPQLGQVRCGSALTIFLTAHSQQTILSSFQPLFGISRLCQARTYAKKSGQVTFGRNSYYTRLQSARRRAAETLESLAVFLAHQRMHRSLAGAQLNIATGC
jgi:hypothetical protein